MIAQSKIDLAVLLALFDHAEHDGEPLSPSDISHLLKTRVSQKRVSVALEELERRGEVEKTYDQYSDNGLWEISRAGVLTVEKAIKIPNSFIFRLNANGPSWLESDEAEKAVLTKVQRYHETEEVGNLSSASASDSTSSPVFNVNIAPSIVNSATNNQNQPSSSDVATWFGSWGTWLGAIAALITLYIGYYSLGSK